jgi:hypothetical protein
MLMNTTTTRAQQITNMRVLQEGKQVVVSYDIMGSKSDYA